MDRPTSYKRGKGGVRAGSKMGSDLVQTALDTIPEVDAILEVAIKRLQTQGLTKAAVTADYETAILSAIRVSEEVYREEESKAQDRLVDLLIQKTGPAPALDTKFDLHEWARGFLLHAAPDFVAFEFRSGQARKSRAGSSWEKLNDAFLKLSGIRLAKPTKRDDARELRQIDRVVPSVRVAVDTPDQAARLSFKTEAREKWRVLLDERRTGHVFLVTLGEDLTVSKLPEQESANIVVYVPQEVKDRFPEFKRSRSLRPMNNLVKDLRRYST